MNSRPQWYVAVLVGAVWISTVLEEELDHFRLLLLNGHVKRRVACIVAGARICARRQRLPYALEIPCEGAVPKRGTSVLIDARALFSLWPPRHKSSLRPTV